MATISIIRSKQVSESTVRACIEDCQNTYAAFDYRIADFSDSPLAVMLTEQLFDVSAFGLVYLVPIKYCASSMEEYGRVASIRSVVDEVPNIFWREHWTAERCDSSIPKQYRDQEFQTFLVGSGRRNDVYHCAFHPRLQLPLARDKKYRKALFEQAINSLGLTREIDVSLDDKDVLRVTSLGERKVSFGGAEPNGANPDGFSIHGFSNIDEVTSAWQTIARYIGADVTHGMIMADVYMQHYNDIYPRLNQLARGWSMDITGEMDGPAALPFEDHGFVERGPGHYPVFRWFDRDFEVAILGTVVVEGDQCRLELACEGEAVNALLKRAAILDGVEFEVVLP